MITLPQEIQNLILEKTDFLTVIENYPKNKYVLNKLYQREKSYWNIQAVHNFNTSKCNYITYNSMSREDSVRHFRNIKNGTTCSIYESTRTITDKVKLDIIIFLKDNGLKKLDFNHFSLEFMSGNEPSSIDLFLLKLYKISPEMIYIFQQTFKRTQPSIALLGYGIQDVFLLAEY